MAQKKKDKRQQKINQRRAEKTRERKKKHQAQPKTTTHGTTLPKSLRQAAPLLEYINQHLDTTEKKYLTTQFVLEGSAELINEPEFTALLINPLDAMESLVEVETLYPDQSQGKDEQMSEAEMYIFNQTLSKLLTPEIQTTILSQLKELSQRQRDSHNLTKAANIEFLYSLLNKVRDREAWITTGLIHGIVGKSVNAGNDLMAAMNQFSVADDGNINSLKMVKSEQQLQGMAGLLTNYPWLTTFAEKKIEHIYKDGLLALYNGELLLELFSSTELEKSVEIWLDIIRKTTITKHLEQQTSLYLKQTKHYVIELATPTRLAEMQVYIQQLIEQPQDIEQWQPFLAIVKEDLVEGYSYEHFLTHAMIGQTMRVLIQAKKILAKS